MTNSTMKHKELIKEITSRLDGATQKQVKVILKATQEVIREAIENKQRVKLFDYLFISGERKKAGIKRNVYTNTPVEVPAHTIPKAEFGRGFKLKLREASKETD